MTIWVGNHGPELIQGVGGEYVTPMHSGYLGAPKAKSKIYLWARVLDDGHNEWCDAGGHVGAWHITIEILTSHNKPLTTETLTGCQKCEPPDKG